MGLPDLPPYSLQAASDRAQLLKILYNATSKPAVDAAAAAYLGGPLDVSGYFPATDTTPTHYYAVKGATTLVLCLGVYNRNQGTAILAGYSGPPFNNPPQPVNPTYTTLGDIVFGHLTFPNGAPTLLICAGHSAGGAVLTEMCKTPRFGISTFLNITTYGMPQVFSLAGLSDPRWTYSIMGSCGWNNYDDPVSLFPPTVPYSGFFTLGGFNIPQVNRINTFRRMRFGKVLNEDLSVSPGVVTTANLPASMDDFGLWLYVRGAAADSPHAILTYASRLLAAAALTPISATPPPPTPTPAPIAAVTAASSRAAVAVQSTVYVRQEGIQNQQIQATPPNALFKARKNGTIWYVYFGGVAVAVGPRRRTAQGLARSGNDFVTRLQRQGAVDVDASVEAWTAFYQLASQAGNGYVPVLAPR